MSKAKVTETLMNFISEHLTNFLQGQGKSKLTPQELIDSWKSEENQNSLTELIRSTLPKRKETKVRKPKDPKAPKRPLSSYIYFCSDKRAEIKEKFPDLKLTDIAKKLGDMWKKQKNTEKWVAKATEDKLRYETELNDYEPSPGFKKPKAPRKGPKRPMTAYICFCKDKRGEVVANNPELKAKEILVELGRLWKNDYLPDKKREKWVKKAEEDKQRYEEEKTSSLEEQVSDVEASDVEAGISKASGVLLFMERMRPEIEQENPEWSSNKVDSKLKKLWKDMSEERRAEYD